MAEEPKPIVFTDHADIRMAERGISHNQLSNAIRQPDFRKPGNTDYSLRLEREFHPNRLLVVIVEESIDFIKVITAYWKQLG